MAENVTRDNKVRIVGYLKENNLSEVVSEDGSKKITGNLTIATKNGNAFKVSFTKKLGATGYDEAVKLLPNNTVSIAQYLKDTPSAAYSTAQNMATKLWASAKLEEFAYKKDGKESSMLILRSFSIGSISDTSTSFEPTATFDVEVFLESVTKEVVDGKESGRLVLTGLIPTYNKSMHRVVFVAPTDDHIAEYIGKNYATNDTVKLKGDLVNMTVRTAQDDDSDDFFGRSDKVQYITTFVKEQVVRGGSKTPKHPGEDGAITLQEVEEGLKLRSNSIKDSSERSYTRPVKKVAPTPKPAASPVDGFDF